MNKIATNVIVTERQMKLIKEVIKKTGNSQNSVFREALEMYFASYFERGW